LLMWNFRVRFFTDEDTVPYRSSAQMSCRLMTQATKLMFGCLLKTVSEQGKKAQQRWLRRQRHLKKPKFCVVFLLLRHQMMTAAQRIYQRNCRLNGKAIVLALRISDCAPYLPIASMAQEFLLEFAVPVQSQEPKNSEIFEVKVQINLGVGANGMREKSWRSQPNTSRVCSVYHLTSRLRIPQEWHLIYSMQ
jgi:hypothetical protein